MNRPRGFQRFELVVLVLLSMIDLQRALRDLMF
jgi:hypothetical protein